MRRVFQPLVCLAFAALATAAALADTVPPRDVYTVIPRRNLFDLKGAPAQSPAATPATPPLNVVLSGITTILGNKQALIRIPPQAATPGRPGEPTKDEGFILAEGQREGPIEVLQIDEKNGAVRILASGTPMTLTFEKNAPKLPESPAAGVPPPGAPRVTPMPARPGGTAAYDAGQTNGLTPTGWRSGRRVFGRDYGTNVLTNATVAYAAPGGLATNTAAPALTPVPAPALPTNVVTTPTPAYQITPEEQAILTEVQRQLEQERQLNAQRAQQSNRYSLPFGNDRLTAPGPYLPGEMPPPATMPGRILPQ